jgi:hypothetical protein
MKSESGILWEMKLNGGNSNDGMKHLEEQERKEHQKFKINFLQTEVINF